MRLQKVYRQLRVKDVVLIFLATVAVLHVVFELTIYRDSLPGHDTGRSSTSVTTTSTRSTSPSASEGIPALPGKESEAKRYHKFLTRTTISESIFTLKLDCNVTFYALGRK